MQTDGSHPSFSGVVEETFGAEEHIYALPGSDVNLTCQAQKKGLLVQMQWSKVTDKVDLLAVYHPQYGFYCGSKSPCRSLVAFREPPGNVFEWTLYLRNVSSSITGKYECSFTLYPEGIQTKIYSLKIQTNVAQEECRNNHTIEIEINGTLEIPCFQNTSLEISSVLTFAWLVEDNGTQETLTTRGHPISNSTLFKDRVRIGTDYGLYLSPVQIHDDGRKFTCHIVVRPGRVLRSSTTVKVFGKFLPARQMDKSFSLTTCRLHHCKLNCLQPCPDIISRLIWEMFVMNFVLICLVEMYITSEKRKNKDGFWELKSVLTSVYDIKPAHSDNLTIWCMALSPAPGHKVWNSSSEKITFSLGDPWKCVLQVSKLIRFILLPICQIWHQRSSLFMPFSGKPKDGMSWPVVVAALLFSCLVLFGLGVRKWYQYQKEIMERPPPFKPPPPPIKYTCIQESIGSDLPCHELETL
ncbi:hypothetical protein MJG53_020328 [Ovis ammon polii x Ovis aries]|uniref:Uncharacterized protein n=1 Tax=Ovis ammon polii x Ovis aries TaxID=2918886 RepID=A0ACB9VMQ4_9CETA|nr:hypothetical protein MJT46_019261 [Ovis ammon polii x Ovis aries]KAI4591319.1 hypothetical protein MJG53_020328 [Ovis ammon polii x Ovis aries]